MKYPLEMCAIFLAIAIANAELPTLPHTAQWKVPLFHKRDKPAPVIIHYVPIAPPHTHKETEEFVKKLEYNAQNELQDSTDLALTILDLNHVLDEDIAFQVERDVDEELAIIDQEAGESVQAEAIERRPILLMHQGRYDPVPELNIMMDGLMKQVKKIMKRREMDPLYFTVHKRGIVRHKPGDAVLRSGRLAALPNATDTATANETNNPLGGGIISGLTKLKRFGNIEKRVEQNQTLIRTHFFYGPMTIDLVFETKEGLRTVNSTLSTLAGHALFEINDAQTSLTLMEFLVDSPMEYEIRIKASRNVRLRNLSQSAIIRLFKRSGRMETRLQRCFSRATRKTISELTKAVKKVNTEKQNKELSKKTQRINAMKKNKT